MPSRAPEHLHQPYPWLNSASAGFINHFRFANNQSMGHAQAQSDSELDRQCGADVILPLSLFYLSTTFHFKLVYLYYATPSYLSPKVYTIALLFPITHCLAGTWAHLNTTSCFFKASQSIQERRYSIMSPLGALVSLFCKDIAYPTGDLRLLVFFNF